MWYAYLGAIVVLALSWPFLSSLIFPPNLKKKFQSKSIIITGASSGLGKELALKLAKFKPKLMLAARSEDKLEEVKKHCLELGAEKVEIKRTDVTDLEQCKSLAEATVQAFGGIDIVFANAGIAMTALLYTLKDTKVLEDVMKVDYWGAVNTVFPTLPALRKSGGHIVVVSSAYGTLIGKGVSGYSAAKHALHGFFDCLRIEEKRNKIKVTVVCPGFINTEIHTRSLGPEGKSVGVSKPNAALKNSEVKVGQAADITLGATASNQTRVYFPFFVQVAVFLRIYFPGLFDKVV